MTQIVKTPVVRPNMSMCYVTQNPKCDTNYEYVLCNTKMPDVTPMMRISNEAPIKNVFYDTNF